ncbi:MAG: hypothetical protein R3254_05190, partial [Thiomicrorhabdus sp.]|nr:hypothetical protein [Thiomicrorhabdus sp.]
EFDYLVGDKVTRPVTRILKTVEWQEDSSQSPFWGSMEMLFDLSLKNAFIFSRQVSEYLSEHCSLQIPQVFDVLEGDGACGVVLENLPAKMLQTENINEQNINILAEYFAKLHRKEVGCIGAIASHQITNEVADASQDWQCRLTAVLTSLGMEAGLPAEVLDKTLAAVNSLQLSKIVPLMMDMRWDQFAQQEGKLVGVFDLDAYVLAPVELDFVILECLLTAEQAQQFGEQYFSFTKKKIQIEDEQRLVYRVLFFLMNALGEKDIEKWLNQPARFTD